MQEVGELEFKSRVEELKPAVELNFDPTPAFGEYRRFFPEDAVKHPAKANTKLIEYLVLKYTKPGDVVLDPMAGTGSTCVIASLHGRNSICIDIEERFVEWMKQAKERVEKHQSLKPKGWMIVLQGDARRLSTLLSSIPNTVITSPPYESIMHGKGKDPEYLKRVIEKLRERVARGEKFSRWMMRVIERGYFQPHTADVTMKSYGDTPGNIGNLRGEAYLSAMLRVYSEMYKVLKPGGIAVVIVKPFLRDKRVIDLPYHTHMLMTKSRFKLADVLKLKIKSPSVWRILYYKKNPNVPRLSHEYILVYRKESE